MSEQNNKTALVRRLREETGLGLRDALTALQDADFAYEKALALLKERSGGRVRSNRATGSGKVAAYTHNGRIAAVVEVHCETDFVAKTTEFDTLCRELAMQVASMDPASLEALLAQDYIRDSRITVSELVKRTAALCGENIRVGRFSRLALNEYVSHDQQPAPVLAQG